MKNSQAFSLIKMAELTILDAMIFQEVLSRNDPTISTIASTLSIKPVKVSFADDWEKILKKNYVPIFYMAKELLKVIPSSPNVESALNILAVEAQKIASSRALLRHDLMGRIYHRLLMSDIAKYHATYYTSIPAAWLLARFSLASPNYNWNINWEKPESLADFRVGDLACGSGTLLSAMHSAFFEKHITECAKQDIGPESIKLHKLLLEKILWGFDVLSYAAHLSAVTLALHNPSSIFTSTNIYFLPLTGKSKEIRLGSIDLLKSPELVASLTFTGDVLLPEKKGLEKTEYQALKVEEFDLIIMNPPFTRSVGGNLLFGALPDDERKKLQSHMREILKEKGFSGIGQAGLGAIFIAVADKYLRGGGRLCLVIPRSLLSGVSWRKIRELLLDKYEIELIITSHQAPNSWNFSENTDLSEILIVARKLADEEQGRTIIANLWHKAENEMEAILLADELAGFYKVITSGSNFYDLLESSNASSLPLKIGGKNIGEAYSVTSGALKDTINSWGQLCPFAQGTLNRLAYLFNTTGQINIPGEKKYLSFPIMRLSEIAEKIGPDVRQIHNSFKTCDVLTTYKALWNHDSGYITSMQIKTNMFIQPKPGSTIQAQNLWSSRARLMVAERLWLITNRLTCIYLSEEALSNMWWPVNLKGKNTTDGYFVKKEEHHLIQALWLNSTFGLLGLLSCRQDTRGAWIKFKKETINLIPALDISPLEEKQIKELLELYDKVSYEQIPPFPVQFKEAAKGKGWRYNLDQSIITIITGESKNLHSIYELLAQEPIICLKPLV